MATDRDGHHGTNRPLRVGLSKIAIRQELQPTRPVERNNDRGPGGRPLLQWIYWSKIDATKPFVFKLLPDFPIHGRVIDLQGQPVAGVSVCLLQMREFRGKSRFWLKRFKGDTPDRSGVRSSYFPYAAARSLRPVGRHEPRRAFRDPRNPRRASRYAALRGDTIAYEELAIVTKNMPPVDHGPTDFERLDRPGLRGRLHLSGPSRPIDGRHGSRRHDRQAASAGSPSRYGELPARIGWVSGAKSFNGCERAIPAHRHPQWERESTVVSAEPGTALPHAASGCPRLTGI